MVTQRNSPRPVTPRDLPRDDDAESLSVEVAVRDNLAAAEPIHVAHGALVAIALTLARKLDEGAGMATAAVARELRCTLDAILKGADDDGDDVFDGFLAGLSAPMGHPPVS